MLSDPIHAMSTITRRSFIAGTVLAAQSGFSLAGGRSPASWQEIALEYDVTRDILNLENGNWGVMARPVLKAYQAHVARINNENSFYARGAFWQDMQSILETAARFLGVDADELALTRNATEALQALILGYRKLGAGDTALYCDLDYGSMQMAMETLARRGGGQCIKLAVPEPISHDGLIEFYIRAMEQHPRTKLMLLTHVSHRTGLRLPVAQIISAAKMRGVDVILDAAHSWGQVEVSVPALGAEFVGLNLHKWIGAPLGTGLALIRRGRLGDIALHPLSSANEAGRISGRVHTGTINFAAALTISDALAYHQSIGPARKAARLAALRARWVSQVASAPNITLLTPASDPRLSAGITSLRIANVSASTLAQRLLDEHRIFTVKRGGIAAGDAVRITPALYNSMADMDRFAAAVLEIASDA